MIDRLKQYITANGLCKPSDKILVAVSGGIDSMVLMHLMLNAGYEIAVAHCNFQLRASESDDDELFVQDQAKKIAVPFYKQRFNTAEYAENNGLSVQMAARELRYDWFEEVCILAGCEVIAIAHHNDDTIETVLLNIVRGTGIRGLAGMKPRTHRIIRPLLFANRNEIEQYALSNEIPYRDDSSNDSLKYKRNKIRHKVIPLLCELNPDFSATFSENIAHFRDVAQIYLSAVETKRKELISMRNGKIYISVPALQTLEPAATFLYEFIHEYGFTWAQVKAILASLNSVSGKRFISKTHLLVKDRQELIIYRRNNKIQRYYIEEHTRNIKEPLSITFKQEQMANDFKIPQNPDIACIDRDKISFPLILRQWIKGDGFIPLGMTNSKKLSDFFIDEKMSLADKQDTWILADGEKIIWVVGRRLDDRYKITPSTKNLLIVTLNNHM